MHIKRFIIGRIRSIRFAVKGFYLLVMTEHAVTFHSLVGLGLICIGYGVGLSRTEWILQILSIGLMLSVEGANTAIEKICDFIHPEYNEKIGFIKDIAAGAVSFAAIASSVSILFIYYPYIMKWLGVLLGTSC